MFDRFRAFTQTQQIMLIASVLAVSFALIAAIWFFFLRTPYAPLFTGLRPSDAATIVSELERRKIPYSLSDGGATISVAADKVENTRLKVMTEDLPLKGTVGFELFNKSDMGLTDFAQKINYLRALQGELERTIMTLDGVGSARVHVSLGEDRIFRENQVPPKASATIRMIKDTSLDPRAVQGIQRLIAAAIPKLESWDVVVLDENGRVISSALRPSEPGESLTPALEQKRIVEQYYEARIRQAIASAYPEISVSIGAVAAPEVIAAWNPASRTFPLHVRLSSIDLISVESRPALQNLVAGVLGGGAGDTVEYAIAIPAESDATVAAVSAPPARHAARPWRASISGADKSWVDEISLALIPVGLLAGIIVLFRRARRSRRLTEEQRSEIIARLTNALAQGGGHATP